MLIAILVMFVLLMSFLGFVSFVNRNGEDVEFISNQGKKNDSVVQFDNRIEVGSTLFGLEFTKLDGTRRYMHKFHVKKISISRSGKIWVIGIEPGEEQYVSCIKSFYLDRVISIQTVNTP
jgi:hypothetical protein